jgi:ABC-2 type transport system permease protein
MDGLLIQQSKDLAPDLVVPDLTKVAGTFTKALEKKVADSQKVSMPGAVGLSFTAGGAFTIEPLLMTDAKLSWNRIKPLDKDLMTSADASSDENGASMTVVPVSGKVTGANSAVVNIAAGKAAVQKTAVVTKGAAPAGDTAGQAAMEEKQKKALALQNALNEIMKGSGTPEEKKQKAQEMIAAANKSAEDAMTPEMKKRSDSVRALLVDIMKGPGTPEEKRQKTLDLMASLRKAKAAAVVTGMAAAPAVSVGASAMMSRSGRSLGEKRNAAAGTVSFLAADGDVRGPIPTVLSLSRKVNGKEQRIIVAGDADFMSNAELNRFNLRTANFVFNTALFSWLSNGEFPIDTSRPDAKDKRVNVTADQVDLLKILFIWVLPGILLAFAAILLIRRKRR